MLLRATVNDNDFTGIIKNALQTFNEYFGDMCGCDLPFYNHIDSIKTIIVYCMLKEQSKNEIMQAFRMSLYGTENKKFVMKSDAHQQSDYRKYFGENIEISIEKEVRESDIFSSNGEVVYWQFKMEPNDTMGKLLFQII